MATVSNSSPRELESYRQEECNLTVEKSIRNEHLRPRTNVQQAKSIKYCTKDFGLSLMQGEKM